MAEDKDGDDDIARINANAKKYGMAYAAFSEGFSSPGVNRLVGAVKIGIAAFAVFVVASAIWSAL
jgi:ribosomal protein L20